MLFPHWSKGDFRLLRHSITKRPRAKLAKLRQLLLVRRLLPLDEVGSWLQGGVRGYYNYHSVPGNSAAMQAFYQEVVRGWHQSIRRRSQHCRMTWSRFRKLLQRWIPFPRLVHPHPRVRFLAKHPGQEPYAVTPHARICAGGGQQWPSLPRPAPYAKPRCVNQKSCGATSLGNLRFVSRLLDSNV